MNYKETTQIPNSLFDVYLPKLKPSAILVLLIVLRQTNGWYNPKTKKRKTRDWISISQFQKKTNLSRKTISNAINTLVEHKLISTTDKYYNILSTPQERKGKVRIYYTSLLVPMQKSTRIKVKKYRGSRENLPITKLTLTKLKRQKSNKKKIKKVSDYERINQILKRKNYP